MKGLIIFVKNLVKGNVKTRLAKSVGKDRALEIYSELSDYTQKVTKQVDAERYLFYSDRIVEDKWSEKHFVKQLQDGDDLGGRMLNAFDAVFDYGVEKAVIIGSDCGELSPEVIEEAFKALDSTDLVIGPAKDGGYYLLGMKEIHSFLFENKKWSTDQLYNMTVAEIKEHNKTLSVLPALNDIDEYEDYLSWNR